MEINVHINGAADKKMDELLALVKSLVKTEEKIMKELDDLEVQVAANTSTEQSALLLLNKLHDLLVTAGSDPAKLKQLADSLKASANDLAAAVAANTPPAPPPTP